MRTVVNIALAASLAFSVHIVCAQDLVAFSAAAVKSSLTELPRLFHEQTGATLRLEFGTAGAMRDKAAQAAPFDLIIVTPAAMKELETAALVEPSSQFTLGVMTLAAGVARGHAAPAVGNVDALKKTLLAATSIGIADPARGATTGIYLAKLFEQLGLSAQIKDKLKLFPEGQNAMEATARGEVEISLGQISEAAPVAGLAPLARLPDEVQLRTVYVAAVAAKTAHPQAVAKLLQVMQSPTIQDALRANGFAGAR